MLQLIFHTSKQYIIKINLCCFINDTANTRTAGFLLRLMFRQHKLMIHAFGIISLSTMDGCCPPKQPETTGKMCSTSSSYAVYQHIRRWRRSGRSRLSFFAGSRRRRQSPRADPRRSDRSGTFQVNPKHSSLSFCRLNALRSTRLPSHTQ